MSVLYIISGILPVTAPTNDLILNVHICPCTQESCIIFKAYTCTPRIISGVLPAGEKIPSRHQQGRGLGQKVPGGQRGLRGAGRRGQAETV